MGGGPLVPREEFQNHYILWQKSGEIHAQGTMDFNELICYICLVELPLTADPSFGPMIGKPLFYRTRQDRFLRSLEWNDLFLCPQFRSYIVFLGTGERNSRSNLFRFENIWYLHTNTSSLKSKTSWLFYLPHSDAWALLIAILLKTWSHNHFGSVNQRKNASRPLTTSTLWKTLDFSQTRKPLVVRTVSCIRKSP